MLIELVHPFRTRCHDIKELLTNCNKMSTYVNRLIKQADRDPDCYRPDNYKGDGLELFTEALIKLSPCDGRIGIGNYVPVTEHDTGVDGYGVGVNGKPATVQVKFRNNGDSLLTANNDHLSNFLGASQNRYGVALDDKSNMLIVTTADSLHPFTRDEMLYEKVRCLGLQQLRALVDNNPLFWNLFRALCNC